MTEVTGYNATNDVAHVLHMLVMDTPQTPDSSLVTA